MVNKRNCIIAGTVLLPFVLVFLFWGLIGELICLALAHKECGIANSMAEIPYVAEYTSKDIMEFPIEGEIKYALWSGFFRGGVEIFFSSTASWEAVETYCKKHDWSIFGASPDRIDGWSKMLKSHRLDPRDFPIANSSKGLELYSRWRPNNGGGCVVNISCREEYGIVTGQIWIPSHE